MDVIYEMLSYENIKYNEHLKKIGPFVSEGFWLSRNGIKCATSAPPYLSATNGLEEAKDKI